MCLGIPGQVVALDEQHPALGTVEIAGVRRQVNLGCVLGQVAETPSLIGKWVLVHVGFAMALIDEEEARRTLALVSELADAQDELQALRAGTELMHG